MFFSLNKNETFWLGTLWACVVLVPGLCSFPCFSSSSFTPQSRTLLLSVYLWCFAGRNYNEPKVQSVGHIRTPLFFLNHDSVQDFNDCDFMMWSKRNAFLRLCNYYEKYCKLLAPLFSPWFIKWKWRECWQRTTVFLIGMQRGS